MKQILIFLSVLFGFSEISGQVGAVQYYYEHDCESGYYTFYLYIVEGKATTAQQRTQFNATYSFIRPAGTKIDSIKRFFPIKNNANYTGTEPMFWTPNNPTNLLVEGREMIFQSMVPTLSPTAHYNNIEKGDTIALFAIKFSGDMADVRDLTLYNNNINYPNLNYDYSNGFTLGGVIQLYAGNLASGIPSDQLSQNGPVISAQEGFDEYQWIDCATGEQIAGANQFEYTFEQSGSYRARIRHKNCWYDTECLPVMVNHAVSVEGTGKTSLWPNPASNFVTVTGFDVGQPTELLNSLGQPILKFLYADEPFDVSTLRDGMYFLVQPHRGIRAAFIKQHD